MIPENMLYFLTEDSIKGHIEYMNTVFSRYMIYEKSIPELKGKTLSQIVKMRLDKSDKEKIVALLKEYYSHKTYFNSFSKNDKPCKEIKRFYSSENDFCYRAVERARVEDGGFLYILKGRKGSPVIAHTRDMPLLYISYTPILALDLCEHAYFADYGYNKDEYIRRAVSRLDISKLFIPESS